MLIALGADENQEIRQSLERLASYVDCMTGEAVKEHEVCEFKVMRAFEKYDLNGVVLAPSSQNQKRILFKVVTSSALSGEVRSNKKLTRPLFKLRVYQEPGVFESIDY